ncbi:serine protease 27-like [Gopherus flavomarginatus]|uniref:serine protease 27-like n=1 Tax=Gopherus flavomarginatus TaxID=286002 RepID=UPI0021CC0FB4|nr:serine protease 27-like [Gopherus flavomarginatus]
MGPLVCAVFSRITGGQDAQEGQWPWQISVQEYDDEKREYHHTCGDPSSQPSGWCQPLTASIGESLWKGIPGFPYLVCSDIYGLSSIADFLLLFADIALVQLTEPVNFTDAIRPISLLDPSTQFPAREKCWVTGWGKTGSECKDEGVWELGGSNG